MARIQEFDPNEALNRAVGVFWDKGYFDTSMDDIVKAMGVARYGVYGTWGNKRELFLAVLEAYVDERLGLAKSALGRPDASLPEIRAFFNAVVPGEQAPHLGCLACNAAVELAPHDEEVAKLARRMFDRASEMLETALDNAVRKGELKTQRDLGELAEFLAGMLRSVAVAHSMGYSRDQIAKQLAIALSVLD